MPDATELCIYNSSIHTFEGMLCSKSIEEISLIWNNKLKSLRYLNAPNTTKLSILLCGINTFKEMPYLESLKDFYLLETNISSFKGFNALNVVKLSIVKTRIGSFRRMKRLNSLTNFVFVNNQNVQYLKGFNALNVVELDMSCCNILSFDGMPYLGSLKKFIISNNDNLLSFKRFNAFNVVELIANCCDIQSFDEMPLLNELKFLMLCNNFNLSSFKGFKAFNVVEIIAEGCDIQSFEGMPPLNKLQRLNLINNPNLKCVDIIAPRLKYIWVDDDVYIDRMKFPSLRYINDTKVKNFRFTIITSVNSDFICYICLGEHENKKVFKNNCCVYSCHKTCFYEYIDAGGVTCPCCRGVLI